MKLPLLLAAAAAVVAVACSDPSPNYGNVPGTYTAHSFTTTDSNGTTTNWIGAGGSLQLTLNGVGGVTGRLLMPQADSGGADINTAIGGSWMLSGDFVLFTDTADTFVAHMPWLAGGNSLQGNYDVRGTRFIVNLKK